MTNFLAKVAEIGSYKIVSTKSDVTAFWAT